MPKTYEEWTSIAKGFEDTWNFPKCCGAIDGTHVLIMAPSNCGSEYYNYKGTNSVVLMALVDQNYCFTYVSIGSKGSASDGGILQNCELGQLLQKDLLPIGYCVVAHDAFPLRHYLMKPYKCYRTALTVPQKIFNYRLSRARRIVENAFGILVSRFRVFHKKIYCNLKTVNKLVLAACALHNFLRKSSSTYLPPGSFHEEDISSGLMREGRWRTEIIELRNLENHRERRASDLADKIRDNLKNYFVNEGAVPWQYSHIY